MSVQAKRSIDELCALVRLVYGAGYAVRIDPAKGYALPVVGVAREHDRGFVRYRAGNVGHAIGEMCKDLETQRDALAEQARGG